MNLWIFGDSFSTQNSMPYAWTTLLGKKLGAESTFNLSLSGVSNSYIFNCIDENMERINSDDYVLVLLTAHTRRWFFKNNPELGNFFSAESSDKLNPYQKDAIQMYIEHLDADHESDIFYKQTYFSMLQLFEINSIDNVRYVPGFLPIPGIQGTLNSVSANEFEDGLNGQLEYLKQAGGNDFRVNHLNSENHYVLSDKIYDFFNCKPLDLTSGFVEGID